MSSSMPSGVFLAPDGTAIGCQKDEKHPFLKFNSTKLNGRIIRFLFGFKIYKMTKVLFLR